MEIQTAKRVHHLARHFGVLAIFCLFGYAYTGLSYLFLLFLEPPIFATYWLRTHAGLVFQFIPDEPILNNFFLLVPITIIYFGLVGFQLKNVLNERGKLRWIVLAAFVAFILYLHFTAFQELSLYWQGSEKLR